MCKMVVPLLLFTFTAALSAAEKKPPIEEASNDQLDITATLLDQNQIHQALGDGLDPDILVVRITARPVSDKPVRLNRDDFLLVSDKDGQRSEPFAPGQIAGSESIAMSPVGQGGFKHNRPTMGGVVGIGGGGLGSSPGTNTIPELKGEVNHEDKPNPLLDTLKAKELPEKEITETASGLLYFQSVGKAKPKDLELRYKGASGRLAVRFRP